MFQLFKLKWHWQATAKWVNLCWVVCQNGAGHEKTEAVLGLSWSTSCFSHPFHSSGFCIQGSTSWHQCCKLLAWSHLSSKIKIKQKLHYTLIAACLSGLNVNHAMFFFFFSMTDWKTARRIKSSFMEHAEISWKSPGTSNKNRTHHWHYFPHCKYPFSNLYHITTYMYFDSYKFVLIQTLYKTGRNCSRKDFCRS